jgi:hypothetical protein
MVSNQSSGHGWQITSEEREQIDALVTMLEAAKAGPPRHEQLAQLIPILVDNLSKVYLSFYGWYVAIGAPGRTSHEPINHETFHAWLREQTRPDVSASQLDASQEK